MDAVTHLSPTVGVVAACDFLGVARASFLPAASGLGPIRRAQLPEPAFLAADRPASARALSPEERASVLAVLHAERFQDRSPAAVQATLLDEGQYYLLDSHHVSHSGKRRRESGERRDQLVHPSYHKTGVAGHCTQPTLELGHHQAAGASQVDLLLSLCHPRRLQPLRHWLDGRATGRPLNWPEQFIEETVRKHQVPAGQLNIHADRGRVMTSKPVAFLMADLGRHQDAQPTVCF
jgi:putative transposase